MLTNINLYKLTGADRWCFTFQMNGYGWGSQ